MAARDAQADTIAALAAGVNHYVTKPFDAQTLLARIHAALRTGRPDPARVLHTEAFTIELDPSRPNTSSPNPAWATASSCELAGQFLLIALMYIGRLKPITMTSTLAITERPHRYELPEERPVVG